MRLNLAVVVLAIIGLAGCGKGSETTVTGTVKHQGKPVYTGYVLLKFDDGNESTGNIDMDGNYTIQTTFTGHAKIAVGSPKPRPTEQRGKTAVDPSKLPDPAKWFEIPAKYADPETSGKDTTIKGGDKLNIELE